MTQLVASRIKEATEDVRRMNKGGPAAAAAPAKAADASTSRRKQQAPIIIVSPSSSALLTMYNVKRFLEEGVFETSEQARIEAGTRANDIVTVNHKRQGGSNAAGATVLASGSTSAGERVVKYVVIDGAEALHKLGGEAAWDRVCCVMTVRCGRLILLTRADGAGVAVPPLQVSRTPRALLARQGRLLPVVERSAQSQDQGLERGRVQGPSRPRELLSSDRTD